MVSLSTPEPASVSVVIPCWRSARTIQRAVASVAAQSLAALEVVLVDDASGDDTLSVLNSIRAGCTQGWIKVIALPKNGGPGPARNAGWDAARGEYVAFLDADDAWHPRKLELHIGWLMAHPEVVLSGHRSVLVKEGEPFAVEGIARACRVGLTD